MRRIKPTDYREILSDINNKTIKGEPLGWLTGIMYGAPAHTSGYETCASSTEACRAACLRFSGNLEYKWSIAAGLDKTKMFFEDQDRFYRLLRYDIGRIERKAIRNGLKPCIRINGTTDLPKIAMKMADEFPHIQFYDYTKHPKPWNRTKDNYHLTLSYSGENDRQCLNALNNGVNVAMVFTTKRSKPLPESAEICGKEFKVIDGDLHDLRFLDEPGVIVGLRVKAKTRKYVKPEHNFVQLESV